MTVFLAILLSLIAIGLLLLAIPVCFVFQVNNSKFTMFVSYFGFTYNRKEEEISDGIAEEIEEKEPIDEAKESLKPSKPIKPKEGKHKKYNWSALLSSGAEIKKILYWGLRCIRRIVSIPVWQPVEISLRIGGEDPALIGMLYGYGCSIVPLLPSKIQLQIDSDFVEGVWSYSIRGECRIRPLRILYVLAISLLDFPWWSGYRLYRKVRIR